MCWLCVGVCQMTNACTVVVCGHSVAVVTAWSRVSDCKKFLCRSGCSQVSQVFKLEMRQKASGNAKDQTDDVPAVVARIIAASAAHVPQVRCSVKYHRADIN